MPSRETETAQVSRHESGVVVFEPKRGARIGLREAEQNNEAISAIGGDGPTLLLARIPGIVNMDREARVFSSQYADEHYAAVAMVVGGAMSRILASFFLGLNRPKTPTRAFSDESLAVEWLESVRRG